MSRHRKTDHRRGDTIAGAILILSAITLVVFLVWPALITAPDRRPLGTRQTITAVTDPPSFGNGSHPPPLAAAAAAPPMSDAAMITPPSSWPYTVRPGDTLTAIAAANNELLVTLEADNAAALNGNPNLIHPGQTLTVR